MQGESEPLRFPRAARASGVPSCVVAWRHAALRPLGNVIYWVPPYVITPEELELVAEVTREGLEIATAD